MTTTSHRGPRLSTKLMLLGLALLIVPWFSFRHLVQMESFLIQGQSQAQLLTAEGISTLLNGREDLFNDLPLSLDGFEALYAHPLPNPIRLDARDSDWGGLTDRWQVFGAEAGSRRLAREQEPALSLPNGAFHLLLGERGNQLYAFLKVRDESPVWRNPNLLRLDNADHIRLSYVNDQDEEGRLQITMQGPGVTTAYHMDSEWKFAEHGLPDNRVQGYVETTSYGYNLEFRMPMSMLGSRRLFGLAVVNVDDPETRVIRSITQTLPKSGRENFHLVALRSPEVLNIVQGLGYSGARILVIDAQRRVRAEAGSALEASDDADSGFRWLGWLFDAFRPRVRTSTDLAPEDSTQGLITVGGQVIDAALQGEPSAVRRRRENGAEVIMAAHPIVSRDRIIGTVVVEQNTDDILDLQRDALARIVLVSAASLLAVFVALLAFSARLAWRIRRVGSETTNAIDQHGRLKTSQLHHEISAGDEIGDLARSVSNMLTKLHQHNKFLENMPRTLRHEINNPLNAVSTSLQNLEQELSAMESNKYLESAKRGVMRIGVIVQNLADAANLEESLESEELEIVDLQELLDSYVSNCRNAHPDCSFVFRGSAGAAPARVADYRIEQLLDKIIDNAVDFHWPGSPIRVSLDVLRDTIEITVANRGPLLPPDIEKSLFDSMVSQRVATRDNRLHFGLGLYVVRVIAERHGGSARASNLADGSGVAVTVSLPLATAESRLRAAG
ncbi:MAG: hypothetical protein JJT88_03920 [Gammaproteobacteria bacterium]|nr:hypothetical protein [Gammaproteobacteria bacterium]